MVARFPDSEPRMSPRKRSCRAYQLAEEPESAVTMAFIGQPGRIAPGTSSIGLTGSASTSASASIDRHHFGHAVFDALPPGPVLLAPQLRDQRAQRRGRVADQVDLVGVAHPDELAVDNPSVVGAVSAMIRAIGAGSAYAAPARASRNA